MNEHQQLTRNIRKPGKVGNLNFCTFTQIRNGLTSWSFEIPASAYCHPLPTRRRKDSDTENERKNSLKMHNEMTMKEKRFSFFADPKERKAESRPTLHTFANRSGSPTYQNLQNSAIFANPHGYFFYF
ncbi:MAG: hypothetical protein PHE33_04070 [Bacteroidales bacterium]|nr:hypothetical protein [Bacteroidales bacterium]